MVKGYPYTLPCGVEVVPTGEVPPEHFKNEAAEIDMWLFGLDAWLFRACRFLYGEENGPSEYLSIKADTWHIRHKDDDGGFKNPSETWREPYAVKGDRKL